MGNVRFRVAVLLSILVMELTWVAELHAATPADIIVLHDGVDASDYWRTAFMTWRGSVTP